jgi:hypothetical protein
METHSNDPRHLQPALACRAAAFHCEHCESGLLDPAEAGVCTECRFQLGTAWWRCHQCQNNCELVDRPTWGMWSACCRAGYHRVDADELELHQMVRQAYQDGEARAGVTLLRLAVAERCPSKAAP